MATLDTYYQGESIPLTLTLTDKDGNVIDLDTLDDIQIKCYHRASLAELAEKTLSGGTVVKTDAVNGICDVIYNGSETSGKQTGIYKVQVKTTETDADYTPKRYRFGQIDAFKLNPAIT